MSRSPHVHNDEIYVPRISENYPLDKDEIVTELSDYDDLIDTVEEIYCEITGGKISNHNVDKNSVLCEYNEYVNKIVEENIEDLFENFDVKEYAALLFEKRYFEHGAYSYELTTKFYELDPIKQEWYITLARQLVDDMWGIVKK